MARIGVFVGTVYGGAEEVAQAAVDELVAKGHVAELFLEPQFDDFIQFQNDVVLVVTSTTGEGEIPNNLLPLYQSLNEQYPLMPGLGYGVIAMGDSSYGEDRYCGAGRQFDDLLLQLQGKPLMQRLDIDASINLDALEIALSWLSGFINRL